MLNVDKLKRRAIKQELLNLSEDDPSHMDLVRKYSAIYGRFDSKRKNDKPMNFHEVTKCCRNIFSIYYQWTSWLLFFLALFMLFGSLRILVGHTWWATNCSELPVIKKNSLAVVTQLNSATNHNIADLIYISWMCGHDKWNPSYLRIQFCILDSVNRIFASTFNGCLKAFDSDAVIIASMFERAFGLLPIKGSIILVFKCCRNSVVHLRSDAVIYWCSLERCDRGINTAWSAVISCQLSGLCAWSIGSALV